ncbi:MAG: PIN domain-containing protein [Burkholderiales bacterium]
MSRPLVIDTNIVLDLFLFDDPAAHPLKQELDSGAARWLATAAMRCELARVLGYPNIARWLERHGRDVARVGADVLARFDQIARLHDAAAPAPLLCRDPDDQPFIDLAWAHGADLASKDGRVLELWRRLAPRIAPHVAPHLAPHVKLYVKPHRDSWLSA